LRANQNRAIRLKPLTLDKPSGDLLNRGTMVAERFEGLGRVAVEPSILQRFPRHPTANGPATDTRLEYDNFLGVVPRFSCEKSNVLHVHLLLAPRPDASSPAIRISMAAPYTPPMPQ
jgi:hypothetical protein